MTLPKKTTRPGQEVEGEVELALTIRKAVQACPEVPPSLVAPAIGFPSLFAPVKGPGAHPNLVAPVAVTGPGAHPNLVNPAIGLLGI